MKMTPMLWRVVSVWLCVAVVCWYPSCYVGCTETQQEAQRPVSSQDLSSEEESGEEIHHHKAEESLIFPAQFLSDNEKWMEDDRQKEDDTAQEVDGKQYLEAFGEEELTADREWKHEKDISLPETEPEQISENPPPETSATQDPGSDITVEPEDNSNILNLQESTPDSVSADTAAPDVVDSDPPPADCEELEEKKEGEGDNPYDNESSPPIVLENTSNVHTAGTKTHTDQALSPPAAHGTEHLETNTSHGLEEQDPSPPAITGTDSSTSSKDPEDIPTFDEWSRKMMEMENGKTQSTHTSNNGAPPVVKKVQKNFNNYASVECGAKILGSNPEAKSTSAILKENMDMYMLNPCSNKIWFIIELCEPIQVKQLDIANFELFSSTPKDFLVSISDRYPTNKWLKLGTFHARDERTVQSFPLDEHLYAKYVKMFTKYIKVELVSHFGSEHFCPLSLIRVFGTSMVEEYEEIADPAERPDDQDDDLDDPAGHTPGEVELSNNLIGSAKDVILNMVNNIAVNVLGGGQEMQGNISSLEVNTTEPSPILETTSQTTDLTIVPQSEVEDILPDPDSPATEAPSSETPTAETIEQELPPVEGNIIVALEKNAEEHISSTITLLDEEEEPDEEKEKKDERQQEIQIYCSLLSSCAASLQEYLHQQCAVVLSRKRKCQTVNRKQVIPPIQTPSWQLPLSPSASPEPHIEEHQPHEEEQASEQEPESGAETPGPDEESHQECTSEPPLLEPSQTSILPTVADSSPAKPTPIVETPQMSSEEPEKSQDVLDEEKIEPSDSLTRSIFVKPSMDDASVAPTEEKSDVEASKTEIEAPIETQYMTDESQVLQPVPSPHLDPDPPIVPEGGDIEAQDSVIELEPSGGHIVVTETKLEDFAEDFSSSSSSSSSSGGKPAGSDIYAETPNGTEPNGNPVHGSSQRESVFMRLSNRIKALEMNMSLSGRYLEQLSQRYRKQMDEMQKAFNQTIIKLQNTSRIAEEQDQRQTDSIQVLQGQLENVTQLVLNLSVRVSQLQSDVSDRQNYLLLSLLLCLCLGLLLYANHCRFSDDPPTSDPEPPPSKSYTFCCPERPFSSCGETGLKRSASYPLIQSLIAEGTCLQHQVYQGPDMLHAGETQSLCPANRKRRRRKMKPLEKVETLKPSFHAATELCNGAVVCNGVPVSTHPIPFTKTLLQPMFRDSPSEGSSEGSSHSDDPSFCGITTACNRICDGLPQPRTRAEKRALRRGRPKASCGVVDLIQIPRRVDEMPISTIHDLMKRHTEQRSGTYGVNVPLAGPV
ncbi:SUN domain-containing ossification factor-like isoform X1 [Pseudochaenichthys georgianus]|uniref:SUN domain-containing ossification factor-like isoform X1 n=1 Tax=Pseudochaenichthys georgianus TaxID=52239 RepID=UPI00146D1B27|nr:SUN domain-containing ossification factor-like isoform X1 [Pseudochaenichthys georgianus]